MADPVLIRFDRKVWAFLGLLLLLLALSTVFKLHGSSIGIWNGLDPDRKPDAGVLLGTPQFIRSDEFAITTPMIVSQARVRPPFPVANRAWGPAQVPLIFNMPVRHWSMLVRPQFWGFFVLDLERAFSFYWNMKALLLVAGVFLLLMLLTESDFGISLLGATWVFFSGFMQWWYSSPTMLPEMVGCVALLLVAAHYLALSVRRWVIGASALVVSVCLLDSVLSFYPPFQVSLLYLGVAILIGSLGPRLATGPPRGDLAFRAGCAALALSAAAVLLAVYYRDAKPTIELMLGTIYPGSRTSSGGEVTLAQVFGGFYGFFMSAGSYPRKWFNVVEASNFVLLFPVPMTALLWRAWRRQRVTALEWSLIVYLVAVLVWMTVGWPRALAAASVFEQAHGPRSLLGLGLASIFLCCIFLSEPRVDLPAGPGRKLVVAGLLLILFMVFALDFDRVTEGFATLPQVALVSLVAGAAGYLLLARGRIAFAVCILVPSIWGYGLVNPLAVGLGPILDTRIFQQVSRIVDQDPDARWAVYGEFTRANRFKAAGAQVFNDGGFTRANLFKAAGAQVLNGTNVVPPLDDFRVVDPGSSSAKVYNRFAQIALLPEQGPGVTFRLISGDFYMIAIDPKSDLWHRLGIRYVALPFASTDREFLGRTALVLALPDVGLWIYRYHWSAEPRSK